MKLNRQNRLLAALGLAVTLTAPSAFAGTLYWDGAGSWLGANEWSLSSGGPNDQTWTAGDDAVFNVVNSAITGGATSFNSITANENVTVSGTATMTGTGTGNVTVAAGKTLAWGLSNLAGNMVKLGDGEMTIGQTNSGITGFTIGAGTVTVATFNALGEGGDGFLTINGGTLASGGSRNFSGKFSALNFGGNFAVTAPSLVSGFTFNAPTSLGNVVSTITTNTALILDGIVSSSGSGGGITKEGAAEIRLGAGNHTYSGPTTVNAGAFNLNGSLTGGGAISTSGAAILTQAATGSIISGDSSITQGSTGISTLAGNNTYTGTTTATAGVLLTTKAAALSGYNTTGKVTFNGGTIAARVGTSPTNWSTDEVNTLLAEATKTSGALGIDIASGSLNQWVAFTTEDNFETLGLTKLGAGALVLTEANTYTGATTVIAGTLNVTGSLSGGGAVSVTGGTFSLAGSLTGGSAVATSGAGIFNQSLAGVLSGATSFTQGSSGTSVLSLTNSHTGGTTATAGTITLNGNLTGGGAVSTSGTGIITQGAASIISGASSFTQGSTGTSTLAGANSYSGDTSVTGGSLNLNGNLTGGGAVSTSGTAILTQGAASVISGNSSITQGSTGFSTLAGNNTYSGNTTATAGTLFTTKAAALSGYDTAGKVTFNGGTIIAKLGDGADTGWSTAQVDTLLAGATKTSGALGIDTTNGNITQWTGFNTSNFGALGLTKLGANTLTLNQANSYTGPTTIAAGAVTINSIGTVGGGNSSLGAPTNATNGTISMGSAGNAAQITYLGTAQTTDRVINLAGTTGGAVLVSCNIKTFALQAPAFCARIAHGNPISNHPY